MRPIKVTAHMAGPIAGDPPQLDAILEYVVSKHMRSIAETSNGHRHRVSERRPGAPVAREDAGKVPIPIKRTKLGGWLVPHCSAPIMPESDEAVSHYTSMLDVGRAHMVSDPKIIARGGGEFKSYRLPLQLHYVDRVVWFARLPDKRVPAPTRDKPDRTKLVVSPTKVRGRLKRVEAVGKKTAQGYGKVARWEVEPVDEDWSWYAPHGDGQVLMRRLPLCAGLPDDLIGYRKWFGAPVPPYWSKTLYTEIVEPC